MNQDTVIVVTVTYNCKDLLEDTILSVINQSYNNIEYIIIDGASTDGTLDIIKKYEKKISYWRSEPDDGIYYAMNKAIEIASGEWINFMNAGDSFFDLDTVEYVMDHKHSDAEMIYGNFKVKETGMTFKARDKSLWHQQMPFCHQTLFTKTQIMKKEKFDTAFRLASDHNFIIKMYNDKKNFFYIDRTLANFTMGGFAQSNELLMDVESIKVFLDNKVSMDDIEKSYWYLDIQKKLCTKHTEKLKVQESQINSIKDILAAIHTVTIYKIHRSPLKKYISYKKMLSLYFKFLKLP